MLLKKTPYRFAISTLAAGAVCLLSYPAATAQTPAPETPAKKSAEITAKEIAAANELAANNPPGGIDASAHSSALFDPTAPIALALAPGMTDPTPPPAPPVDAGKPKPSQNVTINLINRLVERGVLTKGDAAELITQAEADAAQARAEAKADAAQGLAMDDDTVRVTYVPETVKAEIREQLKDMVLAQARVEGWANPRAFPDWTSRVTLFGDVRLRYEGVFFPDGNDNTGSFPNFNAINTGAPFDISGTQFSPQQNVDQERLRLRLRARLGVDVNLEDGFSAGMRVATGESNTPTSTNQTLGLANQGQGGNFSKYAIWLDRGFIRYDVGGGPSHSTVTTPGPDGKMQTVVVPHDSDGMLSLFFGRFDNPFFSASEIIWDEDVGFDGVALKAKVPVFDWFTLFLAGGVFPVFNTDFNFSSNQPAKFESEDKWLYAGQIGFDLKPCKDFNAKVAAAIYDFDDVQGRLSTPYIPLTAQDASDADNSRPSFAQKGNTYRPIRDIIPNALNNFGTTQQFQYFGLASPFQIAAYTARLDFNSFEPFQISLLGEYAVNLHHDAEAIDEVAVNNRGAVPLDESGIPTGVGSYEGGDTAWNVALIVGKPVFEEAWDWNASVGYRYVESDAVVDAFTDSDFGLGGTNMEGYTIGAAVALSKQVRVSLRWMSATQIAGPPLKSDVFLFDLTAKF
jgi:hypothetical protein